MEYIIPNTTKEERERLESKNIDWCFDETNSANVIIEGDESEYNEALRIIGRT